MDTATISLLVASWGAVTGTTAIYVQLAQYFADRSRLKLSAAMSMESNERMPEHHLVFKLDVVNHGRRVSHIRHAGIRLDPRGTIMGGKTMQPVEEEITLFDADETGRTIEITEGKPYSFVREPFRDKRIETFRDTEVAFVTDTRGRVFTTKFLTIRPKHLPQK